MQFSFDATLNIIREYLQFDKITIVLYILELIKFDTDSPINLNTDFFKVKLSEEEKQVRMGSKYQKDEQEDDQMILGS